jgi:hypothetical protein
MLPTGGSIQVTGEEKHLDTLTRWLRPQGECWTHVTLHEIVEHLARSTREIVEIRIDDGAVGQLTPKMSSELLPAIRHATEQRCVPTARAIVKGNRIKAEVVLHVARAHELPDAWLDDTRWSSVSGLAPIVVVPESAGLPAQRMRDPIP